MVNMQTLVPWEIVELDYICSTDWKMGRTSSWTSDPWAPTARGGDRSSNSPKLSSCGGWNILSTAASCVMSTEFPAPSVALSLCTLANKHSSVVWVLKTSDTTDVTFQMCRKRKSWGASPRVFYLALIKHLSISISKPFSFKYLWHQ